MVEEEKEIMYKIDNLLSRLWILGDIDSYTKRDIIDKFPPRLKEMI